METINVNALKAKFGRVEILTEPKYRFSRFLASANLSANGTYGFVRRLVDNYAEKNKIDIKKNPKLCFDNVNSDEINTCISEFVDVLDNISGEIERKEELKYIDQLLDIILSNGKVDSSIIDNSINHDRIPRHIAMYFFSKVDENYWEDRGKSEDEVYKELNENIEGRFSKVIYDIRLLQSDVINNGSYGNNDYTWAKEFLEVFRYLRNWKDHFADNITKDGERCAAACFILYTFAANYFAIKKNLIQKNIIEHTTIKEKKLSVYLVGKLSERIKTEDRNEMQNLIEPKLYEYEKEEISPIKDTSNSQRYDYTIKKEKKYVIKIGLDERSSQILDMEMLWDSPSNNPVVIYNGVTAYAFSDYSNIPSQLNTYTENAEQEDLTSLKKNIESLRDVIKRASNIIEENNVNIKVLNKAEKIIDDRLNKLIKGQETLIKGQETLIEEQETLIEEQKKGNERQKENERREKEKSEQKDRRRFITYQGVAYFLFAICIAWLAYNDFEAGHNICFINHKWIYYASFIVPVGISVLLWMRHKMYYKFSTMKSQITDAIVTTFSFIVIACTFFPNSNKSIEAFISSYDIDLHDSLYNQNVAQFLESYVSHNNPDELARIKLTEFYLSIQDEKNALRISSPMKDFKRYKEGCCLSAEALYHAPDSINVLWGIINGYKSEYGEIRPAELQYIEGDLLIRGEGRSTDINTGMNILRKLADSGYPKAQYRFGYYNSKNQFGFQHYIGKDPKECHTPYDLFTATEYLRKAASKLPEAALELGCIYADLAVKDSAEKYFNLVILRQLPKTPKLLRDKANYYKSMYYSSTNRMKEADSILLSIKESYMPAKMYYASRNNDIISVINTYEYIYQKNKYEGTGYIDPLVYAYIAHGDDQKALERLTSTRPEGNFNNDFIKGIKYFIKDTQHDGIDTLATNTEGLTYIKNAASQGCVYARMLIDYDSAKFHIIHDNVDISPLISDLHRIGETIPFAFVLESKLLTMLDREYPIIEEAIYRAMGRGQTSGTWLLASMPSRYIQQLIDKWVEGRPETENLEELGFKRSLMEGGLRYLKAPCKKQVCLYNAFLLDLKYDSMVLGITMGDIEHKNRNLAKLHFWTDVAIANHAYFMYSFLFRASCLYNDEAYKSKLFEAALNDYPTNVPTNDKAIYWEALAVSHWTNIYTHAQMHLSKEYLQNIQQSYSKKPIQKGLFSKQYIVDEDLINTLDNRIPMEAIWVIEDESFAVDKMNNIIRESFIPRQPLYLHNDIY